MGFVGENLLGAGGLGALGGSGGSGALGGLTKVLGAAGGLNPVGAAAMAALAVGKGIAGKVQQNKADKMLPKYEDPEERALASYAARRKRAFQTGTATAASRNALRESMKTGIEKSIKVGGGAKGLNMMTRMFNQAQLGLAEKELAGETKFAEMESQQKNRISQRKLELGLLKYNTAQARGAQQTKEGKSLIGQGLARAIGIPAPNPYGSAGQEVSTTGTEGGNTSISVGNEEG